MKKINVKKLMKRLVIWLVIIPILLFFSVVLVVYWKQDKIVQNLITSFNEDFTGKVEIEGSHVSPFENFPYISIDLEDLELFETKKTDVDPIVDLKDIYVGFNIWDLISGNYDIKILEMKDGFIHAVQNEDGELNITKALETKKEIENVEDEFNIHLKLIKLIDVDIYKLNSSIDLMVESFVDEAKIKFISSDEKMFASVETHSELNIIKNGDTSFVKRKHLNLDLELEYLKKDQLITISPSELELENATFQGEGTIDIVNDYDLNLRLYGEKKSFDLFIAMAPEELVSTLNSFDNAGEIEFNVDVIGKSSNGNTPLIKAVFGCKDAYVSNVESQKKIDNLNFSGHFTNNGYKGMDSMEFSLKNFRAKPAAGSFSANILVKNFNVPDIEMSLDSDFDLDFLAKFINTTTIRDAHGKVKLHMKFHDIIDLTNPEKSIEKLNEAYFTELKVEDLGFKTSSYHLPLSNINTKVTVQGHQAEISYFDAKIGKSNINLSGHISDLPAIIHHTDEEIVTDLSIESKLLDIKELTSGVKGQEPIDERIDNLRLELKFISSARNFTESPNLPVGEFFVEKLFADLNHYPHTLHDFRADFFIEDTSFRVIDFSGMIDNSDFHFNGKLENYNYFMEEHPLGDVKIEFDLTSDLLKLEDIFSYKGENFVPKDYRHEQLSELKVHGSVDLLFNDGLKSSDLDITQIDAKMNVHPMKFKKFNGRVHYQEEQLEVQNLSGQIGNSNFMVNLNYYLGSNDKKKRKADYFSLKSNRLDFDELFNYNDIPSKQANSPSDHEDVFNIYDIPFPEMAFDMDIKYLNYHRYKIQNFKGSLRTTPNHYLFVDTLSMNIAGGSIAMSGYFNGSDRDEIYFTPNLSLKEVSLDKLLFKFENFGQDYLVSENIHGNITSSITGKIRMHADLVPIIDKSEIHMDLMIRDGRLVNYAPIVDLKDYFIDKNVNNIRFDTLQNHIDLKNGMMTIPKMTINSSLGYMLVSGAQDMKSNMEYYIKVPLKLIVRTGFKTLFGKPKNEVDITQEDEIEYLDSDKKSAYVNIKIEGDSENFKVSLGKDKKKKKSR